MLCCGVLLLQAKLGMSGGYTARVYSLWKLLHKPFDGRTEQPQNWEDLLMGEWCSCTCIISTVLIQRQG
jgi:hypothetical protein